MIDSYGKLRFWRTEGRGKVVWEFDNTDSFAVSTQITDIFWKYFNNTFNDDSVGSPLEPTVELDTSEV